MKKFIKHISLFFTIALMMLLLFVGFDFFKIFKSYDDVYTDSFVGLNRGVITYKLYEKNKVKTPYNAFILGNSRSQAFKCTDWAAHLPNGTHPFHFDANTESIYGIATKLEYLHDSGAPIDHALLVIDRLLLEKTSNNSNHLFIGHPAVTKQSYIDFYSSFLRASLNPQFIIAYLDFKWTKTYKSYMSNLILKSKYPYSMNTKTGDLYYGYDQEIKEDSLAYYNDKIEQGIFYKRPIGELKPMEINDLQKQYLKTIAEIFQAANTNYKIVISPKYDQIPLDKGQMALLKSYFGQENIYDFSGINSYSTPIGNFYETSHFRPHVAKSIMEEIY
jgi:hypothetical protein